eukprot:4620321-Pleurochrysis_carterae.AAC.1
MAHNSKRRQTRKNLVPVLENKNIFHFLAFFLFSALFTLARLVPFLPPLESHSCAGKQDLAVFFPSPFSNPRPPSPSPLLLFIHTLTHSRTRAAACARTCRHAFALTMHTPAHARDPTHAHPCSHL